MQALASVEAYLIWTDTHTHMHKQTTVTLSRMRQGLIIVSITYCPHVEDIQVINIIFIPTGSITCMQITY